MTINDTAPRQTFQALEAALRPPRAVVVYDGGDHWVSNAALAMHTCQGIWGGSGFLLIPHDHGQVSQSILRLARAYDPDYVVNLPMTISQFEAINPGVLQLRGTDGKPLEGAERTAALECSHDQTVSDPEGCKARTHIADDCTPHRVWLPDGEGVRGSHHVQTQHLDTRDYGPFTSIEQIGSLHPSDGGIPSELTGPWALAAAMYVGFAEAPPLPFMQGNPVDDAV
jgi:hypothetical protein